LAQSNGAEPAFGDNDAGNLKSDLGEPVLYPKRVSVGRTSQNDGTGTISRFGRFNPIYRFSDRANSAGAVFNYKLNPQFSASVGYRADGPQNTVGSTGGLIGGSYSALAQLEFQPTKNIGLGLTYVHAFQETGFVAQSGGLGSNFANSPFTGNLVGNTGPASSIKLDLLSGR
jgi:Carbohydrate-selective porin, OprB family